MGWSWMFSTQIRICVVSVCALGSCAASAAVDQNTELVVGLTGDATSLTLYSKPDDSATAGTASKQQLQSVLPLPIVQKQGDFVEVKFNGNDTWLDLMDIQRRFAKSYCADFAGQDVIQVASGRGIGDICK